MSSLITPEYAIRLRNVSKIYKLYGSQRDQLVDILGLGRFGIHTKTQAKEYAALSKITLDVPRGHRIGIVGRNGAGKTTLLKLICGNFAPTSGSVEVRGGVQALMNVGLGFHPEYSGRENVEASLQYSGLSKSDYRDAFEGIIEFCELGEYLDQPFKTYSLGMQARLMFAAATAVRPDILIVDEILGAGDAYFVAKSRRRMEGLIKSGCTMLLVSHSMSQVLELCDEVIWLDKGQIRMRGDAFEVVKSYEESVSRFINSSTSKLTGASESTVISDEKQVDSLRDDRHAHSNAYERDSSAADVSFVQHSIARPQTLMFQARGGVSRWDSGAGLKIVGFEIRNATGVTNALVTLEPAAFLVNLKAEVSKDFSCRLGVAIYDETGRCLTKIISPIQSFRLEMGDERCFEMSMDPLRLGPGEYVVSLSVHRAEPLEYLNSTVRYDLLNRSFCFKVSMPETLNHLAATFFQPGNWSSH